MAAAISLATSTLPLLTAVTADATPASSTAADGQATSVPVTQGTVDWGACADSRLASRKAQCAMVKVPLDYSKPNGTKISLAVSRIKHTVSDDKYQGVVLVNPGGPGGSGEIYSVAGSWFPKNAGAAYDWIGFDPRGVGSSEPAVSCDKEYAGYNRPDYVPSTPKKLNAWMKKTHAYTRDCKNLNGAILRHLTTRDSAKDMDSIRKALGQSKINYLGFSYGTYLGQVYASLFPDRMRRMIFDGTVDPRDVWYKANLNQDVAFDRNINIWFGWLAKYDSVYHLGKTKAAVRKLFYSTQKKLYREPVQGEGGKLGGSEWLDSFLYAGYYQSTWTDLGATFSAFINDDDVSSLEAAYLDASGYGDDNGYAVYLGVQCTDVKWPKSWDKWAKDNWRVYAKAPFETWANAWFNEPCRHWPAPAQTPVKVKDKGLSSLLMVNETLDAATPYPGSIEVRKRFRNARLIAEPGGTTHSGSLSGNSCVDDRMADYLLTGALPARKSGNRADVNCAPLPQPDPTASAARTQAQRSASGSSADSTLRRELQRQIAQR